MHEQPCATLWDVNYIPPQNHTSFLVYLFGIVALLVPCLPILVGVSFGDLAAAFSITYFCTITALA